MMSKEKLLLMMMKEERGQVGELAVDDEGKLLLRCAERDARRASSVLIWKKVISRGEMRERATFLWKRNLVRKIVIFES